MYVQSLKVSGFMSFKDVVWNPERLNVLIGPNGSGKSNLLRALELIRASAAGNLREFVLSKGGLPRLLWGEAAQQIEFGIDTSADQPSDQHTYRFTLAPLAQSGSFRVASEALAFEGPSTPFRVLDMDADGLTVFGGDNELLLDPANHLSETETA